MKRKLLILSILISILLIPNRVDAYTVVNSNNGFFAPVSSNIDIVEGIYDGPWSSHTLVDDAFIYSFDQFWVAGEVKGNYINVSADYIVAFETSMPFYNNTISNGGGNINRNPLKKENLRCGIGDYRQGYNESYAKPDISNFLAYYTYYDNLDQFGSRVHVFRITFNYKQYVPLVDYSNTNMSCWFEITPNFHSVGAFSGSSSLITNTTAWTTSTSKFEYLVTDDPNITYTNIFNQIQGQNDNMINQNNTIINQNNSMIDQNNTIINNQNTTNDKLDNINDSLTDSNIDSSTDVGESFFSGFSTDTFGLTSIITAPLNLIQSITNSSCSPLGLEVPFVGQTFNLPCMSTIYNNYFGDFMSIYQTITFGIVAYWVCVRIFNIVKDFKNPDHDEIEVLDL